MTREELIESLNKLFIEDKIDYDTHSGIFHSVVDLADAEYERGKTDAFKEIAYSDDFPKEPFEILAYNKALEDYRKMCGVSAPHYTNCIGCPLAHFENDFNTTICKLEQLKK